MRIQLAARRDALEAARQAMLEMLRPLEPTPRLVYRAELVLEEVLMNVVMHAYPQGDEQGMAVEVDSAPGEIVLRFEDHGIPFDPSTAAPPIAVHDIAQAQVGGLGVSLVKRFAKSLSYERRDGMNRLRVSLARD